MIDLPNFVRVGPDSSLLICFDGRVLPATFQELVDHFEKLIRNPVPLIMLDTLLESIGLRRTLHKRGHNVPSDPSIGNMIECGKLSRKRIRVLVRGGRGDTQREVLRCVGHSGDEQTDVEDWYL
jgi:hypothetical protein